jgi:hypothetical protein
MPQVLQRHLGEKPIRARVHGSAGSAVSVVVSVMIAEDGLEVGGDLVAVPLAVRPRLFRGAELVPADHEGAHHEIPIATL